MNSSNYMCVKNITGKATNTFTMKINCLKLNERENVALLLILNVKDGLIYDSACIMQLMLTLR